MKILYFFLFLWVIFALLDPRIRNLNADPDPATQINADPWGSGSGSGSETLAPGVTVGGHSLIRRKIRLIEDNAKCRHLRNGSVKGLGGTAAGVYLSQAGTSYSLPPYTPYSCIRCTYSHRKGGRGLVQPERRAEGH